MTNPVPGNVISGIDVALISLNAVTATGAGLVMALARPRYNLSMQVSFTSNPSSVKVVLEGSIDGVNWFILATFDTGATSLSGDIVTASTVVVLLVRARLVTLTGGTNPTVTATIVPGVQQ